jgi:hypothetical protein
LFRKQRRRQRRLERQKLSSKKGSLYEEDALMDSIIKKIEFSNNYRGKKNKTIFSLYPSHHILLFDYIVEIRELLVILLKLHEREKALFLSNLFTALLQKIKSHIDSLFPLERLSISNETPFRGKLNFSNIINS